MPWSPIGKLHAGSRGPSHNGETHPDHPVHAGLQPVRRDRVFESALGFACTFQADNYAFLRRDGAAIRLLELPPECDLKARQHSFYIDVEDIDGLFGEVGPGLEGRFDCQVRAPFDQDYGQREFHVSYDHTLIFFGEGIRGRT